MTGDVGVDGLRGNLSYIDSDLDGGEAWGGLGAI